MKINHIIREKRKELSLTQEQVAEFLGVSTPAVNKWEKGSSYPDITLLPALARLLKTDLNTLLSFQDDLSDIEIVNFVDEIDKIVREKDYDTAFKMGIDKIHEYPTCESLIYSVIMYLNGALFLYGVTESERYEKTFIEFYERLSTSQNVEIRETVISMLIAYNRKIKNYSKAEELINTYPSSSVDKEEQLAILYTCLLYTSNGDKHSNFSVANSREGSTQLVKRILSALTSHSLDTVLIGLEATSVYGDNLVYFLREDATLAPVSYTHLFYGTVNEFTKGELKWVKTSKNC